MSTLTHDTTTIDLELVTRWDAPRNGQTRVHTIIGRADPDITLGPLASRTGNLDVFCTTFDLADAVVDLHATGEPVTYVDSEEASRSMVYVVPEGQGLTVQPADQSFLPALWVVSIPFAQVTL